MISSSSANRACFDEVVIDHFGINCADWAASTRFYDGVLGVLGYRRMLDLGVAIGYGDQRPVFWIADQKTGATAGRPNRETHVAFVAAEPERVQAFFRTALSLGAEPLHEPRLWPEYHADYYGAFVRDPDGNNVEAVFHGGAPGGASSAADVPADVHGGAGGAGVA